MKQILESLNGSRRQVILGPVFKLIEAVLELMVPLVMAGMIDAAVAGTGVSHLARGGVLLVVLAVSGVAAAIVCQYYAARAAGVFGRQLRSKLYAHLLRLSGADTAAIGTAGLVTRLANDTIQLQTGLNMAVRLAVRVPFLLIGNVVVAFIINWKTGLVFLAATGLVALVLYLVTAKTLPMYADIQYKQDTLASLAGDNLQGVRIVRAFGRQTQEQEDFAAAGSRWQNAVRRAGYFSALLSPATTLVVNGAALGIVWLGGLLVPLGGIKAGEIIALVNYMSQTLVAMLIAANLVVLFTRAAASYQRIAALFDTQPAITDGPGAEPLPQAPVLAYKNVSFAYHKGAANALEDISLSLMPGQTLGVIGGTGSGKSTFARLLWREIEPGSGKVFVQGNPVQDYTLKDLRAKFGVVPQDTALFSGSIRHNLLVADRDANEAALWQALEIAQAADFIKKMPQGLDTPLVEGGKNLSGGQRQRLAVARALVRRPEILVLDDVTSALDYATDAALRRALKKKAWPGLSVVQISQRAAALRRADSILVLDEGRMAGFGTHAQLLASCGIYREICVSQGLVAAGASAQKEGNREN